MGKNADAPVFWFSGIGKHFDSLIYERLRKSPLMRPDHVLSLRGIRFRLSTPASMDHENRIYQPVLVRVKARQAIVLTKNRQDIVEQPWRVLRIITSGAAFACCVVAVRPRRAHVADDFSGYIQRPVGKLPVKFAIGFLFGFAKSRFFTFFRDPPPF